MTDDAQAMHDESQESELVLDLRLWMVKASEFIRSVKPRNAQEANTQAGLLNSLESLGVHRLSVEPPTPEKNPPWRGIKATGDNA